MIDNLKNAYEAHSHAESQQTSGVADESYQGYLLVSLKQSVVRIADKNLQNHKVIFGILVNKIWKGRVSFQIFYNGFTQIWAYFSGIICQEDFIAGQVIFIETCFKNFGSQWFLTNFGNFEECQTKVGWILKCWLYGKTRSCDWWCDSLIFTERQTFSLFVLNIQCKIQFFITQFLQPCFCTCYILTPLKKTLAL